MPQAFSHRYTEDEGELILVLSGAIDESAEFPDPPSAEGKGLAIDLGEVTFINSLGVRKWCYFMESLKGLQLQLTKVPTFMLDQVNLVDGFIPNNSTINSFFVPYHCDSCDSEQKVIYYRGREYGRDDGEVHIVKVQCQDCQIPMELSVLGERYFRFLKIAPEQYKRM